jgi:CheY-like chemotaxis protein
VVIVSGDSLYNEQSGHFQGLNLEKNKIQIMIGVSESELLLLFKAYLSSLGMRVVTARGGQEVIDQFVNREENGLPYDFIVLDTHLLSPSGLDVAQRIHSEKPDQNMVLVTTTPKENLRQECLKTAGIKDKDILIMPFKLSRLRAALTYN